MQTRDLPEFMTMLPGLVSKASQVVVATYNSVEGHQEGVTTLTDGKPLRVLCGNGSYRHVEFLPGIVEPIVGADESVRAGASKVIKDMDVPLTQALVILYAGLTQFYKMWSLTQRLVQNGNTVVVFGCGCPDNNQDIRHLSELENVVAVTPDMNGHTGCDGGRGELAQVVDFLVDSHKELASQS